ncbi:MAG: hypothetical protein QXO33_04155 [Nitrososphaeria archaeon]
MKPETPEDFKPIFKKVGYAVRTKSKSMVKIYIETEKKAYYIYFSDVLAFTWGARKALAIYELIPKEERK